MKIKPWPIVFLALINFLGPIGNIVLSAYLEKISVASYLREMIQNKYYFDLVPLFVAPWIIAYAIFAVQKWSFSVFTGVIACQTLNIFYQGYQHPELLGVPTMLAICAVNFGLGYYFLLPEVRSVYKDRSLRWWQSKPRYTASIKCRIQTATKRKIKARISDMSEGGMLLRAGADENLAAGDLIEIRFSQQDRLILVKGKIVYSRGDGGFGVEFEHVGLSLSTIRDVVHHLKRTGAARRGDISLAQDFNRWTMKLLSKGEGWKPEVSTSIKPKPTTTDDQDGDSGNKAA